MSAVASSDQTRQQVAMRRKMLGLSRRQLGVILRVNDETVSRWERGETSFPAVRQAQVTAALDALEVGYRFAALASAVAGSTVAP